MKNIFILVMLAATSAFGEKLNGVYADSNNVIKPGYTLKVNQLAAWTNCPGGVTNTVNHSFVLLSTSGQIIAGDPAGTIFSTRTNGLAIIQTNGNSLVVSNGVLFDTNGAVLGTTVFTNAGTYVGIQNGNIFASSNLTGLTFYGQLFNGTLFGYGAPGTVSGSGFIIGGSNNVVANAGANQWNNGVVGGERNNVGSSGGFDSLISGGQGNVITVGSWSFIGGGYSNMLYSDRNAILGGSYNTILNGNSSLILGGNTNSMYTGQSSPFSSLILAGANNYVGGSYSVAGGFGARAPYNNNFVWADTNVSAANSNLVVFMSQNGFAINTNSAGTNSLFVRGTTATDNLVVNGTNVLAQFSVLSAAFYSFLSTGSNNLQVQIYANSNGVIAFSNAMVVASLAVSNYVNSVSNLVQTHFGVLSNFSSALANDGTNNLNTFSNQVQLTVGDLTNLVNTASNVLQSQIGPSSFRAGTIAIANGDVATTYSFATPMPDTSYQVIFTPYDSTSQSEQLPITDSQTVGHFIAHMPYATNHDRYYRWAVLHDSP